MKLGVIGAGGATGRELVAAAVARGHEVTAIVRDPSSYAAPPGVTVAAADATDPESLAHAVSGLDTLLSGLGATKNSPSDLLESGAMAAVASGVPHIVWLGAFGTGRSAVAAGRLTSGLLRLIMGAELPDKAAADEILIAAGATVFHAGQLSNAAASASARVVPLIGFRRAGLLPRGISRATVAQLMVAEAEQHRFGGEVVVPLG